MKTCPHCRASYADETLFYCLADGHSLVSDDEQETLFGHRQASPSFEPASPANSPAPRGRIGPILLLVAAVLIGSAIIAAAVIYTSIPASEKPVFNTAANSGANKPVAANKPSPPRNTPVQTTPTPQTTANAVETGRLDTNQRIRSDSHKHAEILGVHYQGARIEVLEKKSYTTVDGEFSTWYRVRVIENGCDRDGKLGCGNDLNGMSGKAAKEGWMNARYITLD